MLYICVLALFYFNRLYEDITQYSGLILHALSGKEVRFFMRKRTIAKIPTIYSKNLMRLKFRKRKRNRRYNNTKAITRILLRS